MEGGSMILPIDLPSGSYEIHIVSGGVEGLPSRLSALFKPSNVVVVSNPVVYGHHGKSLDKALKAAGYQPSWIQIPDGEASKNMDTYVRLLDRLDNEAIDRNTPLIALVVALRGILPVLLPPLHSEGSL
jgi:3-dehydroquinate synthase